MKRIHSASHYLLIFLVTAMLITAMSYSFYSSSKMINKYGPLIDAAMEIKLEATTAHLWFEEILSGDRHENLADVIEHIDLALWYCNAMLKGGENDEGIFLPLEDATLTKEISDVKKKLFEFKKITFLRNSNKSASGVGSDIDQQYDHLFNQFIRQVDEVETLLQLKIAHDFKLYQFIQVLLIATCIFLSCIAFIIQFKHGKKQRKHTEKLNKAKEQAEKNEQWLNTLLNSMGDGVIATDVLGNVTRINPIAEAILGWNQSEAQGQSIKSIFPIINATTRESIENPVDIVIRTGKTVYLSNHTTLISKDGTEYQIADSAAAIRDADNTVIGMVLVFNDITEKYRIREQLARSMQRLSLHWQDTPIGMIEWDTDFKFLNLNPAAEKIFGYSKAEVENQHITQNILPESAQEAVSQVWKDLLAQTGGKRSLNENITKDGRTILCEWYNTPLIDANGAVIGVSSVIFDVTKKHKSEEQLRLAARVFNETSEGIMVTDPDANIIDVNPAFSQITGYTLDDVIGKNAKLLNSGKQSPEFYTEMWQSLNESGHWQGEVWNHTKTGKLYAELLTMSQLLDHDKQVSHYVGIFSDITQHKQQQAIFEEMAHYDVLTKLPNRALLTDRFSIALAHSKRKNNSLAICFLDIDNFKPVNDTYGHDIGDQLLIEAAERIKIIIRNEDTISRQGGDEFILLLGDIDTFSQCEEILKRTLSTLAQPFIINDNSLSISASIGVTLSPADDADLDTLVRHADHAMYQAKQAGRNRYHLFNSEQDKQMIAKNIRLDEIQNALSNNELCLYYQPKVNMQSGEVFGAEALLRWNHPVKGLILPLTFLPIIDATPLEIEVGDWVIDNALNQLSLWVKQGIQLEVSINISSIHLQSASFIKKLANKLSHYPEINPKFLQLEILESSALGDIQLINRLVALCRNDLGIKVALDDFGTGYSSLTHLRNLPINTIKIDQSFIRDMLDDPNDYSIIEGVLGLASAFNKEVIAEGVETEDHGLLLLLMGCIEAQGYAISHPIPAPNFINWLDNYKPNQKWLNFNKNSPTQDKRIDICKLAINLWLQRFEQSIQSPSNDPEHSLILDEKQCFCNYWLKRAKHEQLFTEHSQQKLEAIHNEIHNIANDLHDKCTLEHNTDAQPGLKHLHAAVNNMRTTLSDF